MKYADALQEVVGTTNTPQRRLLGHFMAKPNQTLSGAQATALMGYKHFIATNGLIGRIGKAVYEKTGQIHPEDSSLKYPEFQYWSVIAVSGGRKNGSFAWRLRPNIVKALTSLGFRTTDDYVEMPEEMTIADVPQYLEGRIQPVWINAYERNPRARAECLRKYGYACSCCGINMQHRYQLSGPFIHVHHLKPLSSLGKQYLVNPIKDLRPVCPNCHAALHVGGELVSVEELKKRMSAI